MGVGEGEGEGCVSYAALQITLLHMKSLTETETPIFVLLCVQCFQGQPFFFFFLDVIVESLGQVCYKVNMSQYVGYI